MEKKSSVHQAATGPRTMAGRIRAICAASLLLLLLAPAMQAQFNYTTNNGTVTITGYTGSGGDVTIPDKIEGLPVTRIGDDAFYACASLTGVVIGNSVTRIGNGAFDRCTNLTIAMIGDSVTNIGCFAFSHLYSLTNVTIGQSVASIECNAFAVCSSLARLIIPNSVTGIGYGAFLICTSLTNITIGNSVTHVSDNAFRGCTSLTTLTMPGSLASIGVEAFSGCIHLTSIYFKGNAPSTIRSAFYEDTNATVYYLPGTTGWDTTLGGAPTAVWPQVQTSAPSFGVGTNGFGFNFLAGSNAVIVVEAATNLASPVWESVGTNTLTNGSASFSDPGWTNQPSRFYRLRSP